jgi:hypothetical protein
MATGPEHYREAERLLASAGPLRAGGVPSSALAAAQVHATLALAAAQAPLAHWTGMDPGFDGDVAEWRRAVGVPPVPTEIAAPGTTTEGEVSW